MAREAYKIRLGGGGGAPVSSASNQANAHPPNAKASAATTQRRPAAVPPPRPQPKNPAKVGKADPVRDMFLFLGFLGFMFFISSST